MWVIPMLTIIVTVDYVNTNDDYNSYSWLVLNMTIIVVVDGGNINGDNNCYNGWR